MWVPVDENNASGLRAVTPKRELDQYRAVLKSQPDVLERDHNKRRLLINERVKHGSFQSLCEVVRDLSAQGWKRPLSEADMSLLQRLQPQPVPRVGRGGQTSRCRKQRPRFKGCCKRQARLQGLDSC